MKIDNDQQTTAALKWLYEMEVVDSPVLRANLYENIFLSDSGIIDCAAWLTPTFTYQKGVLVWVRLNLRSKWLRKQEVFSKIESVVRSLLPSYNVRIVEDRNILEMAQKKVEEVYGGGDHETNKPSNKDNSLNISDERDISESFGKLSTKSDLLPNTEKQTENKSQICNESEQFDPQDERKAQDILDNIYRNSDE